MATTVGLTFDETEGLEKTEKFKCPHCDKEYAKEEYLKNHIAQKHMDEQ